MPNWNQDRAAISDSDRIDTSHDYAMCAWARHFNVSEHQVREAVAAVGDRAMQVKEHLHRGRDGMQSERPSAG
jgi:hypothetical protein